MELDLNAGIGNTIQDGDVILIEAHTDDDKDDKAYQP